MQNDQPLTLKIQKLTPQAIIPSQAHSGDAGLDLIAIDNGTWNYERTYIEYKTGLAIELPPGYHSEIFPRSSITKTDLILANSIGLVDNGYRGELLVRFKYIPRSYKIDTGKSTELVTINNPYSIFYKQGDKIAQLVIRKTITPYIEEVAELSSTERATGGFGSTGK